MSAASIEAVRRTGLSPADLDVAPPLTCEVRISDRNRYAEETCPARAIWHVVASCGHAALYCDAHKVEAEYRLDRWGGLGRCPQHWRSPNVTFTWRKL